MEHFSSAGPAGWVREVWHGELRSVAEFYIPFRLFKVDVQQRQHAAHSILGLDSVRGTLELYRLDELPSASELVSVDTRNCAPVLLTDEQAEKLIRTKVRRITLSFGFLRSSKVRIEVEPVPGDIYVPYWVGFRGRTAHPYLTVLDAVHGQPEGSRLRELLHSWLLSAA